MIKINCDLGERGADHPVDMALMKFIQVANIACGGHAGDARSVSVFRRLADDNGVMTAAHLSYPDRKNFGRTSLKIDPEALMESLDAQMQLVPDVKTVKFHGALYNDSVVRRELADLLAGWARNHGIDLLIAPHDSEMAEACARQQIGLMAEAFAERRYTIDAATGRLRLVKRGKPFASIHDTAEAIAQAERIASEHKVAAIKDENEDVPSTEDVTIAAETICIHSDSAIALELARGLARLTGAQVSGS